MPPTELGNLTPVSSEENSVGRNRPTREVSQKRESRLNRSLSSETFLVKHVVSVPEDEATGRSVTDNVPGPVVRAIFKGTILTGVPFLGELGQPIDRGRPPVRVTEGVLKLSHEILATVWHVSGFSLIGSTYFNGSSGLVVSQRPTLASLGGRSTTRITGGTEETLAVGSSVILSGGTKAGFLGSEVEVRIASFLSEVIARLLPKGTGDPTRTIVEDAEVVGSLVRVVSKPRPRGPTTLAGLQPTRTDVSTVGAGAFREDTGTLPVSVLVTSLLFLVPIFRSVFSCSVKGS